MKGVESCVASGCAVAALPDKMFATHDGPTCSVVSDGFKVTYTCTGDYQISPTDNLTVVETERTVTCNTTTGIFEDLNFQCVRK